MQNLKNTYYSAMSAMTLKLNAQRLKEILPTLLVGLILGAFATDLYANTPMPWEGPICQVAKSLSGPTAKALAVIAVVICGLMLAFMELGGIFKTFMSLLMGIAMALMAGQWTGFIDGSGSGFC